MPHTSYSLKHLHDRDVLAGLHALVRRDGSLTAELLSHLAEVDARRLYLAEATPSLFVYCVQVLNMSEDMTYKRIQACRAARSYPYIFELVASGELHLSAVVLLAPHLTLDNHRSLLDAARKKSKRAVEELVASRFARPDVAATLRKLPSSSAQTNALLVASVARPAVPPPTAPVTPVPAHTASPAPLLPVLSPVVPRERHEMSPLSLDRYRLQVTLSTSTRDKLLRAQDLLRHKQPDGDLALVLDAALTKLCDDLERRKFGKLSASSALPAATPAAGAALQPAPEPPPAACTSTAKPSRYISRAVRRAVAARDNYQCTFVSLDDRRCSARGMLEFHHLHPYALGGAATASNTTLRCHQHNLHQAVLDFGAGAIQRTIGARALRFR